MAAKLGQNFLIDKNIAKREVEQAGMTSKDIVLEIGPGNGILTNLLAEKAKKVIAIEIDKKLFNNLDVPNNVELINADALKVDFKKLMFNKIVSNLPFQISSPVTFKLLECNFDLAVLIYQKEFADRMIAKPKSKNYSRLSVNVYYRAECEMLNVVSKNCFKPQPKVDSAVIRLVPMLYPAFSVIDENFFFGLTTKLFNHRRKKIKTTLKEYDVELSDLPYLDMRVEELNPEQIGKLSDVLFKRINR